MPRTVERPRLWLRKARRDAAGRIVKSAVWIILDSGRHIATGCTERQTDIADRKLAEYIAAKYQPQRHERPRTDA